MLFCFYQKKRVFIKIYLKIIINNKIINNVNKLWIKNIYKVITDMYGVYNVNKIKLNCGLNFNENLIRKIIKKGVDQKWIWW